MVSLKQRSKMTELNKYNRQKLIGNGDGNVKSFRW